MKKIITILCSIAMVFLCACGKDMSNSKYVGTWIGTTAEYSGMTLPLEEIYGTFNFELDAKGKATVTTEEDSKSGKWDESENGVSIDNGDVILTEEDGHLVLEQDGMKIIFEKK